MTSDVLYLIPEFAKGVIVNVRTDRENKKKATVCHEKIVERKNVNKHPAEIPTSKHIVNGKLLKIF